MHPRGVPSPNAGIGTYESRKAAFEESNEYQPSYVVVNRGVALRAGTDAHLDRINAAAAYADGWTGRGQVIAVADTGFRDTHQELLGKTVGKRTDVGYIPDDDDKQHGTWVASVAAGARSGLTDRLGMQGVAFDAQLHYTEVELGTSDGVFRAFDLDTYDEESDAKFYSRLLESGRASGARIINLSFGVPSSIAEFTQAQVRSRLPMTASIYAQTHTFNSAGMRISLSRADADKSIFVWAAGNSGSLRDRITRLPPDFSSPTLFDGLGVYFPEVQTHTITVVALDQDGTIADYSNRCGLAKNFCIAAPGSQIVGAGYTDAGAETYNLVDGTSFAAPIVSGALAVVRQRFSMLGTHELVERIKVSATKTDPYDKTDIYGQGLLNLGAAIAPIGAVMLGGVPLAQNFVAPGGAFGDALEVAFAKRLVTGFDSLNAPFDYALDRLVIRSARSTLLPLQELHANLYAQYDHDAASKAVTSKAVTHARLTDNFSGAGGFALRESGQLNTEGANTDRLNNIGKVGVINNIGNTIKNTISQINANASSHMHLSNGGINFNLARRNRITFSAFTNTISNANNRNGTPQVAGLRFAYRPKNPTQISNFAFGGGYLREGDALLQSAGGGAFGGLASDIVFFAAGGSREVNHWRLQGGAEVGVVLAHGDSWLSGVSRLFTSSFSLSAARRVLNHDEIRFGLSSPLRIEHGNSNLILPTARSKDGATIYRKINPSLTPSGRQLDLTATWQRPLPIGRLTWSTRIAHEPNHTANAPNEFATLIGYQLDF